jgi:hypothetical protein
MTRRHVDDQSPDLTAPDPSQLISDRGNVPVRGPRPELRILNAAAQTRTVSVAGIRLDSRKSVQPFKGIFCDDISEFESFSIGAGWCQALSDCSVDLVWDVPRRVLASLRDRHLGPPMMGSGGCGGPIYRDVLAVRPTTGIRTRNGLASSIVPAGTSLHRSAEFAFLLSCSIVHNSL